MTKFSLEEILYLHYMAIEDFGGSHGVRDESRLLSVVESPFQHVFGKELYESLFDKAAVYMKSIITDHPFADGNKRTATMLATIFLHKNGFELNLKPIDLADFAVKIAVDHLSVNEIADWLQKHSV